MDMIRIFTRAPIVVLTIFLMCCVAWSGEGPPSHDQVEQLLSATSSVVEPGARIIALSGKLLGTPYVANTLSNGPRETERLVINLSGFDCFTLLDTVEALRRSTNADDFPEQLREVRYRGGEVSYTARRHFFSDWVAGENSGRIADVTAQLGNGRAVSVNKQLNRKSDGTLWLQGIASVTRRITYIPGSLIDQQTLQALRPGDYVGIYSDQEGLDVSHTGLIVIEHNIVMLRHASSRRDVMKVVDVNLLDYLKNKPGLVVYRVKQ